MWVFVGFLKRQFEKTQSSLFSYNHISTRNCLIFTGDSSNCRPQNWLLCEHKIKAFNWVNNYIDKFLLRTVPFNEQVIQLVGPLLTPSLASQCDADCTQRTYIALMLNCLKWRFQRPTKRKPVKSEEIRTFIRACSCCKFRVSSPSLIPPSMYQCLVV